MSEANERRQLETLTERDVRLDVPVGDIGTADFERMPDGIVIGERTARAASAQLAALSVSEAEYFAWRRRMTAGPPLEGRIAEVRFGALKPVNPAYLRTLTRVRPGDIVDLAAISQDATKMAALDDLDGVEYQLSGDPSRVVLTLEADGEGDWPRLPATEPRPLRRRRGRRAVRAFDPARAPLAERLRRTVAQPLPARLELDHRDQPVSSR